MLRQTFVRELFGEGDILTVTWRSEGVIHMEIWGRGAFPGRGNSTYKGPGIMPCMLEEQQGGWCGWSRVSKGEKGRREGQGGGGEGLAGSCGLQENLGFYPEGDGSPEVL